MKKIVCSNKSESDQEPQVTGFGAVNKDPVLGAIGVSKHSTKAAMTKTEIKGSIMNVAGGVNFLDQSLNEKTSLDNDYDAIQTSLGRLSKSVIQDKTPTLPTMAELGFSAKFNPRGKTVF